MDSLKRILRTFFRAVCMDLLAELPRLRKPKALAGWLIQVTRNKCFHRKRDGQRHPVQEMGSDYPLAAGQTADSLVAEFQQDQLLREALTELASRCRQLVYVLFFEMPARPYELLRRPRSMFVP
jgi:DNA-directed RNA polymerase specialized sigma24 family protein